MFLRIRELLSAVRRKKQKAKKAKKANQTQKVETMNPRNPLDTHFIDTASLLRDSLQQRVTESNFYCKNVKKSEWPKPQGTQYSYPIYERTIVTDNVEMSSEEPERKLPNFGSTVRTLQLKKAAINSPDICLDDLQWEWQVEDVKKNMTRVLRSNSEWIWSNAFQNAVLEHCQNRILTRYLTVPILDLAIAQAKYYGNKQDLTLVASYEILALKGNGIPGVTSDTVQFPPRINFFGKRVYPYETGQNGDGVKWGWEWCGWLPKWVGRKIDARWSVNPKYKEAAEQMIVFHPDIVEFVFPDLEHWVGDLLWRNMPDSERNPDGNIGFYRMLFSYAAKPLRPEFGTVITVLPPGLKGWLWYWAWILVGFKP